MHTNMAVAPAHFVGFEKKSTESRWPTFSPVPSDADVTGRRVLVPSLARFLLEIHLYH